MRVLVMMPKAKAYSEAWAQRMTDGLFPHVAAVAAGGTGGADRTDSGLPLIDLNRDGATRGRHVFPEGVVERAVRQYEITHVLCHFGTLAVHYLDLWPRLGVRVFVHFHGPDATFDLRAYERPDMLVHEPEYPGQVIQLSRVATLIANSQHTRRLLVEGGVPPRRVVVKPLGVPLARRPIHHAPKPFHRVAFVGKLLDARAPDKTVRAFERACELGLHGELLLAGQGPMEAVCRQLALASQCSIRLLGVLNSEQVSGLMMTSDLYTQHNELGRSTGQEEALGVTILEAMGVGLPVVATRSGGVPEIVVAGRTGALVEPGDVDGQAHELARLAADPELRNRLAVAAWERVRDGFTLAHERERLLDILCGKLTGEGFV